jgi:hypothetical protein
MAVIKPLSVLTVIDAPWQDFESGQLHGTSITQWRIHLDEGFTFLRVRSSGELKGLMDLPFRIEEQGRMYSLLSLQESKIRLMFLPTTLSL